MARAVENFLLSPEYIMKSPHFVLTGRLGFKATLLILFTVDDFRTKQVCQGGCHHVVQVIGPLSRTTGFHDNKNRKVTKHLNTYPKLLYHLSFCLL